MKLLMLMAVIIVFVVLLIPGCSTTNTYVSNGKKSGAGPKAKIKINTNVDAEIKGIEVNEEN